MTGVAKPRQRIGRRLKDSEVDNNQIHSLLRRLNSPTVTAVSSFAGGSAGSGQGTEVNYLPTAGGTMIGAIAFFPKLTAIATGEIDISKTGDYFSSRVIISAESGTTDDLVTITGAEHAGQLLFIQGTATHTITIKNTGNIETIDGADFDLIDDDIIIFMFDSTDNAWQQVTTGKSGATGTYASVALDNLVSPTLNTAIDFNSNAPTNFNGYVSQVVGNTLVNDTGGATWTLPSGDTYLWQVNGADQLEVTETTINVKSNGLSEYVGWTADVGQTEVASATGLEWTLPTADTYSWKINGVQEMALSNVGLAIAESLTFSDSTTNPSTNGEIQRNGSDVKVYTGGALLDLSDVPTQAGTNTFTGVNSFTGTFSVTGSSITLGDGAGDTINLAGTPSIGDGLKWTFNPNGTNAGINVGSHTAAPSTPANGDMYYNSTSNIMYAYINSSWTDISAGGSGVQESDNPVWTGIHTFNDDAIYINNPAKTFQYIISTNAISADRTISLPTLTTNDVFTFNTATQTLTNKGIDLGTNTLTGSTSEFNTALQSDSFGYLGQTNTWTGINSFNGTSTSINSATIVIGDATTDNVSIQAQLTANLVPDSNITYNLGTSSLNWSKLYTKDVYFGSVTRYIGYSGTNDMIIEVPSTGDILMREAGTTFWELNGTDNINIFHRDVELTAAEAIRANTATEIGYFVTNSSATPGNEGTIELPFTTSSLASASAADTAFGAVNGAIGIYESEGISTSIFIRQNDGNWTQILVGSSTISGTIDGLT